MNLSFHSQAMTKKITKYEQLIHIVDEETITRFLKQVAVNDKEDALDIIPKLDDLDVVEFIMLMESHYDLQIDDSVGEYMINDTSVIIRLLRSINRDNKLTDLGV